MFKCEMCNCTFLSILLYNKHQVKKSDSRYEAAEIMANNFTHLAKAAIFSLGMVVYEAGGGGPLPKADESNWFKIRTDNLKELPHCSRDLNDLLKVMIHEHPKMRPSAESLIQHPVLCPLRHKTLVELRKKLDAEMLKYKTLAKKVQQRTKYLKAIMLNVTAVDNL